MKKDIAALTEQLTDVLNNFAGTASKQANNFADTATKQANRGYKQARSNAESMMSDWSDRGSAIADSAMDAASSLEESLEDVIHDRPLLTLGVAVGLGFLIGASWRR